MKEFKFWAMRCSLEKILLINIPVAIVIVVLFFLDIDLIQFLDLHFFYIWIFLWISMSTWWAILFRRVKITCYPNGDITFSYFGKVVYASTAEHLESIRGVNVETGNHQGVLEFKFPNKTFLFTIFNESKGLLDNKNKINRQTEILRYFITTYQLQRGEEHTPLFMASTYTYRRVKN